MTELDFIIDTGALASPEEVLEEEMDKVSMWVKDKEIFVPSTDITVLKELPPGMYQVDYTNDRGYHCKNIKLETDELYVFTESIAQDLIEEINLFWDKKDIYKQNKLIHKRGILLYGYAGTGKSSYINMISKQLIDKGGIVFKIYGLRNLAHYVDFIKYGFRKIQPATPVITVLEDIDQYQEVELELLDFLDGQFHLNHHVIIATSNNTEDIPDTFLRPSRLDLKLEVPYPSEQTKREYFRFKGVSEEKINELIEAINAEDGECSLADLKELYICVFVLGYDISDALTQVLQPYERRNYLDKKYKKAKIGL